VICAGDAKRLIDSGSAVAFLPVQSAVGVEFDHPIIITSFTVTRVKILAFPVTDHDQSAVARLDNIVDAFVHRSAKVAVPQEVPVAVQSDAEILAYSVFCGDPAAHLVTDAVVAVARGSVDSGVIGISGDEKSAV